MAVIIDRNTILGCGLQDKPMLAHRIFMHRTRKKSSGLRCIIRGSGLTRKRGLKQRKKKGYADKLQAVGRRIEKDK
jgi:hypothetical protein